MRIQHNVMAMNAYRNYTNNVNAMKQNLEKLSSGYKINRAGDDAAGLAISEKMRAQITGLETAQKNAKDGISLVQTAEGALTEVHDMLNRMVELASMSANGTYDNSTDRAQLQKEMDQLKSEINRIADSSNFNGINLLNGSLSSDPTSMANVDVTPVRDASAPVVAANGKYELDLSRATFMAKSGDDEATVTVAFGGSSVDLTIKPGETLTGAQVATELAKQLTADGTFTDDGVGTAKKRFTITDNGAGKLTFTGVDTTALKGFDSKVTVTGDANIVASTDGNTVGNQGFSQAWTQLQEPVSGSGTVLGQCSFKLSELNVKDGTVLRIGGVDYTFSVGKQSNYKGGINVIDLTDKDTTDTDFLEKAAARLSGVANGNAAVFVEYNRTDGAIYLTEKEGGINRDEYDLVGKATVKIDASWKDTSGRSIVEKGQASTGGLTLQIGDTSDTFNQLRVSIRDCHVNSLGLGGINIADQTSAQAAVASIKNAINYVSDVRGTLGATQNRLDHTINNLSVMQENIQDAESTIRDTDVAAEMMQYTKNNILIQSAQAMLAQANQVPQGVLQLLQ